MAKASAARAAGTLLPVRQEAWDRKHYNLTGSAGLYIRLFFVRHFPLYNFIVFLLQAEYFNVFTAEKTWCAIIVEAGKDAAPASLLGKHCDASFRTMVTNEVNPVQDFGSSFTDYYFLH